MNSEQPPVNTQESEFKILPNEGNELEDFKKEMAGLTQDERLTVMRRLTDQFNNLHDIPETNPPSKEQQRDFINKKIEIVKGVMES